MSKGPRQPTYAAQSASRAALGVWQPSTTGADRRSLMTPAQHRRMAAIFRTTLADRPDAARLAVAHEQLAAAIERSHPGRVGRMAASASPEGPLR